MIMVWISIPQTIRTPKEKRAIRADNIVTTIFAIVGLKKVLIVLVFINRIRLN
jgi:hypothetical protein